MRVELLKRYIFCPELSFREGGQISKKLSEIKLKMHYCFLQDTPIMVIQLKLHNLVKVKMMSMSITMTTTIMNMRQKPRAQYPNQMSSSAPIRFWFPYRDGLKV